MEWLALAVAVAAVLYVRGVERRAATIGEESKRRDAELDASLRRIVEAHVREDHPGAPSHEERIQKVIDDARRKALEEMGTLTSRRPPS